jgi:dienelactone hydrolase
VTRRRLVVLGVLVSLIVAGAYVGTPYARATSLIVRAADLGGRAERFATRQARSVQKQPPHVVPTRHGGVAAQFYRPDVVTGRAILAMPGFNSNGIEEPRLAALAADLAGSGFPVMAMALPDLQHFRLTPAATDIIEDAVAWMAAQRELAPDGQVGVIGVSFTGGLSISAAGRDRIRDKTAFVVSLGGHGDLRRVMRYLATGEAPSVPGAERHPPHDYGLAVILHGLADRGVVPVDQAPALRAAIETFLTGSQISVTNPTHAPALFEKARVMTDTLPEPSRTYMGYVNDRAVDKLGPILAPHLNQLGADDPALSPELAPVPSAPIYLLHGNTDNIVPPAESLLLADYLRAHHVDTRVLLSGLITHATVNPGATARDALKLVSFWADVLQR